MEYIGNMEFLDIDDEQSDSSVDAHPNHELEDLEEQKRRDTRDWQDANNLSPQGNFDPRLAAPEARGLGALTADETAPSIFPAGRTCAECGTGLRSTNSGKFMEDDLVKSKVPQLLANPSLAKYVHEDGKNLVDLCDTHQADAQVSVEDATCPMCDSVTPDGDVKAHINSSSRCSSDLRKTVHRAGECNEKTCTFKNPETGEHYAPDAIPSDVKERGDIEAHLNRTCTPETCPYGDTHRDAPIVQQKPDEPEQVTASVKEAQLSFGGPLAATVQPLVDKLQAQKNQPIPALGVTPLPTDIGAGTTPTTAPPVPPAAPLAPFGMIPPAPMPNLTATPAATTATQGVPNAGIAAVPTQIAQQPSNMPPARPTQPNAAAQLWQPTQQTQGIAKPTQPKPVVNQMTQQRKGSTMTRQFIGHFDDEENFVIDGLYKEAQVEGNPAQPAGWAQYNPVDPNTYPNGNAELIAIEQQKREDTAAWEDAQNRSPMDNNNPAQPAGWAIPEGYTEQPIPGQGADALQATASAGGCPGECSCESGAACKCEDCPKEKTASVKSQVHILKTASSAIGGVAYLAAPGKEVVGSVVATEDNEFTVQWDDGETSVEKQEDYELIVHEASAPKVAGQVHIASGSPTIENGIVYLSDGTREVTGSVIADSEDEMFVRWDDDETSIESKSDYDLMIREAGGSFWEKAWDTTPMGFGVNTLSGGLGNAVKNVTEPMDNTIFPVPAAAAAAPTDPADIVAGGGATSEKPKKTLKDRKENVAERMQTTLEGKGLSQKAINEKIDEKAAERAKNFAQQARS